MRPSFAGAGVTSHSKLLVRLSRAFGFAAIAIVVGCGSPPAAHAPHEGDVVFQSLPRCELVDAIEGATKSPFSHCGIVLRRGDAFVVLEALGDVHETPFDEWVARGRGHAFAAFRLRDEWTARIPSFVDAARRFEGRPYDVHYSMDDDAIYCSELVFKAFKNATGEKLGATQRLSDLDWPPFAALIRELEGTVPLDREMITPRALSEAPQLREVDHVGW